MAMSRWNYSDQCGLCGFDLIGYDVEPERWFHETPMRLCRHPRNACTNTRSHDGCYNLTTATDRRKILSRASFTFRPTAPEQARRLRYFQRIAVPMIQPLLGFKSAFPPEVGLCIMSFCTKAFFCHLRILYALKFYHRSPPDGPRGQTLRVPRVAFEGRTYLGMTDYHDVIRLIEDTARNARDHGFAVGMDHFGIRAVITNGLSSAGIESDLEGLWWRVFPPQTASVPAIDYFTDGLKFRDVVVDGSWSE